MDQTQLHTLQQMATVMPFFILLIVAIVVIPYWFIWKKAGFSPFFSILMIIPVINFIMLYVCWHSQPGKSCR